MKVGDLVKLKDDVLNREKRWRRIADIHAIGMVVKMPSEAENVWPTLVLMANEVHMLDKRELRIVNV